jgi:hypothetical protein
MRVVRLVGRGLRVSVLVGACAAATAAPVVAQEPAPQSAVAPLAASSFDLTALQLQLPPTGASAPTRPRLFDPRVVQQRRPAALLPLYGSLVALQGLDIHSTRGAIDSGGREANPMMRPFVSNSAAFIAVKAGATAGVIWASERMWKKNRKGALILAGVVNAAMVAIVANNYRVNR